MVIWLEPGWQKTERYQKIKQGIARYKNRIFSEDVPVAENWEDEWLNKPNSLYFEVGDAGGLFAATDISRGTCWMHCMIWDRSYLRQPDLFKQVALVLVGIGIRKAFCAIPEFIKSSATYLKKNGFREIGRLEKEFFRDGKAYDVLLFELTRENYYGHGNSRSNRINICSRGGRRSDGSVGTRLAWPKHVTKSKH